MHWSPIEKTSAVVAALLWLALGGSLVGTRLSPDANAGNATVLRTTNGVAETGVVETKTVGGEVRRVIRWRTKDGTLTETVTGPMELRTAQGDPIFLAGPTSTEMHSVTTPGATQTVRAAGSTVTLPGQTVTTTETVHDTETETVQDTVTETVVVTETVTAPTP